jgi:hypothetical protein
MSTDIIVPTVTGQTTVTGTQCNVHLHLLIRLQLITVPELLLLKPLSDNRTITLVPTVFIQTRTWIYVDACGNESLPFVQTATCLLILLYYCNWTNNCNSTQCNVQPAFIDPTATDNCTRSYYS